MGRETIGLMTGAIHQLDGEPSTKTVILIQDIAGDAGFEAAVKELVSAEHAQVEVLRCADAWIWDAYGSLMRSVVASVARASTPVEVVIVGYDGSTAVSKPWSNQPIESPAAQATLYLMQHVLHIDPDDWFRSSGNIRERVQQTAQVIAAHPLLPDLLTVSGFVYRAALGACEPV